LGGRWCKSGTVIKALTLPFLGFEQGHGGHHWKQQRQFSRDTNVPFRNAMVSGSFMGKNSTP
jgi:hypothetical protein